MQIPLTPELEAKIEREADARGVSPPEFVRDVLEWMLAQKPWEDPLFADGAVYRDDGADDLAARHDDYLYEDAS